MSLEICNICGEESTPWKHVNGHVCNGCAHPPKWTSIKDDLPSESEIILAVDNTNEENIVQYSFFTSGIFYYDSSIENDDPLEIENVTHWMRLPERPK